MDTDDNMTDYDSNVEEENEENDENEDSDIDEEIEFEPFIIKPLVTDKNTLLTLQRLTKYEKCRILSTRIHQLTLGCPTTLSETQMKKIKNYTDMANLELSLGILPLKINRKLQNNITETIR